MALPLRVVLPYISHTDIAAPIPQRVGFLRRLGPKTGIDFAILIWKRVWFCRFTSKLIRKKENMRIRNRF